MEQYRKTEVLSMSRRSVALDEAQMLLNNQHGNRPLKTGAVKRMVQSMKGGSWESPVSGTIIISDTGNLLDGQNRLSAMLEYGMPLVFDVKVLRAIDDRGELTALGLPLDVQTRRTVSEITGDDRNAVSVASFLIRWLTKIPNTYEPLTNARVLSVIRPSVDVVLRCSTGDGRGIRHAATRSVFVLRHFTGVDVTDAYDSISRQDWGKVPGPLWHSWNNRMKDAYNGKTAGRELAEELFLIAMAVTDPSRDPSAAGFRLNDPTKDRYIAEAKSIMDGILKSAGLA